MADPEVRPARAEDAAEIVYLGALMYTSVGTKPTPGWALESTRAVKDRIGKDLLGAVIDAPEGGLAACGLVNVVPRLPRPGRHSHEVGYVQWVSTAPQHHRKGYGHAVVRALLEMTDRRGIEVIELHATQVARHLYQDFGFFVKTDNIAMQALREPGRDRTAETGAVPRLDSSRRA